MPIFTTYIHRFLLRLLQGYIHTYVHTFETTAGQISCVSVYKEAGCKELLKIPQSLTKAFRCFLSSRFRAFTKIFQMPLKLWFQSKNVKFWSSKMTFVTHLKLRFKSSKQVGSTFEPPIYLRTEIYTPKNQ